MMSKLKLAKLPDRAPARLNFVLPPELMARSQANAAAYSQAYGVDEPIAELILAMPSAFLTGDRYFCQRQSSQEEVP